MLGMPQLEVLKLDHDPLLPVAIGTLVCHAIVLVRWWTIPSLCTRSLVRQVIRLDHGIVHEAPGMQIILHITTHMH